MSRIPAPRFELRNLSLPTRLMLAAFLISVGIGYMSALLQLHFRHARAGKLLPDAADAREIYAGTSGQSQLERLLVAGVKKPFNGNGSMQQSFTERSTGWKSAIAERAKKASLTLAQAEAQLRKERDGERLAVLDWIRAGASQASYEADRHELVAALATHPITSAYVDSEAGPRAVKIASIFDDRCVRCHSEESPGKASLIPLDSWERIHEFCRPKAGGDDGGVSVASLAQTTHIHLLGLGMLYGLTGLIVSLTSYPGWLRGFLAPMPLIAQMIDIACWWLARVDPVFAHAIPVTGSIVALGLATQISLSLFDLFGKAGKFVLAAALVLGLAGASFVGNRWIMPFLVSEESNPAVVR